MTDPGRPSIYEFAASLVNQSLNDVVAPTLCAAVTEADDRESRAAAIRLQEA